MGFPEFTFLEIFGKLANKSKTLHKDLLIFLHIRNQHRKLNQLIYVSNRFRDLFWVENLSPRTTSKNEVNQKVTWTVESKFAACKMLVEHKMAND